MTEITEIIVNAPISVETLRKDVAETLKPYGLTVDEFLHSDIDDLASWELRDLWLIVKGALERSKRDQLHLQ